MVNLIVVDNPRDWAFEIPGTELISARAYLTDITYREFRHTKVFNLCRSYRYQTLGYYVSLLAAARGHKPLPNISTIQDMKSQTIVRHVSDDLDRLIQRSLAPIKSSDFTLSIYFGRNLAKRYDRLSSHLFKLFPAPLVRAQFVYGAKWELQHIGPISPDDISEEHRPFAVQFAAEYFAGKRLRLPKRALQRYDLAILVNPAEKFPPSNERAIQHFIRAAEAVGFAVEVIGKEDYHRLAEFDALFIRETTSVNHHTYRFAQRALAEGLVVIDDPDSILKCTNKVYLAELLDHYEIPTPRTIVVHRDNLAMIKRELGFPCILKQPDSSFSRGVVKVNDEESFSHEVRRLLEKSELVIAQEFLPTEFDWRVGMFNREPLYVCKYFMAHHHWQIIKQARTGKNYNGRVEAMAVEFGPKQLIRTAMRAANTIGDGLYGVDVKQVGGKFYVIEVNENPSIEAGFEDGVLKDRLYVKIMEIFLKRVESRLNPKMAVDAKESAEKACYTYLKDMALNSST